jgi:hypothetical protein
MADEFLDVDAPVTERTALFVRFRDLGLEGDNSFKARLEIRHRRSSLPRGILGGADGTSRRARG